MCVRERERQRERVREREGGREREKQYNLFADFYKGYVNSLSKYLLTKREPLRHTGESLRMSMILNNQSGMGSVVLSLHVGLNSRSLK